MLCSLSALRYSITGINHDTRGCLKKTASFLLVETYYYSPAPDSNYTLFLSRMFGDLKKIIREDKKARLILLAGLIVQVITSITAIGFSNFDQHFSIVEFSSLQLGNENAASYAFELESKIRPTLQVYLFSGFYKACMFVHIR